MLIFQFSSEEIQAIIVKYFGYVTVFIVRQNKTWSLHIKGKVFTRCLSGTCNETTGRRLEVNSPIDLQFVLYIFETKPVCF